MDSSIDIYNYFIAVGAIAMVAVYVPLHAILPGHSRLVWIFVALLTASISAIAALVGAGLGGTLWQAIPTGILMLVFAFLILVQLYGGWHVVRRLGQDKANISISVIDNLRWRTPISVAEYTRLSLHAGVPPSLLRMGSEPDENAVAVSVMAALDKFITDPDRFICSVPPARTHRNGNHSSGAANLSNEGVMESPPHESRPGSHVIFEASTISVSDKSPWLPSRRPRYYHEPFGLALLGSVPYSHVWLDPLFAALRGQRRRGFALLHHGLIGLWWLGMLFAALAKTGYYRDSTGGSDGLRTSGIWVQTVLLVVGVYGLPFARQLTRYGSRLGFRLFFFLLQAVSSFVFGTIVLALGREKSIDPKNVVYAAALIASASAATVWSVLSVTAYQHAVTKLLDLPTTGANRKITAYFAALITRPRHGVQGGLPVLRWGDVDNAGYAALEISLGAGVNTGSFEDEDYVAAEERRETEESGVEWHLLEAAAKGRRWGRD